jgi:hypothetical protein
MLSKSQYTRYIQCPKLFWLSRKDKEKLSPPSGFQQQIFDVGSKVGDTAQDLFPGGIEIPFDIKDFPGMVSRTQELIEEGQETIYEASFLYDDIFIAVDILHYSDGKWHIYEVKSSVEVKDIYLEDASIQAYVLRNSGLDIGTINIVHIDNSYVRGNELDLQGLFAVVDVTEDVEDLQSSIPARITRMKDILEGDEPEREIGVYCLKPYECAARDYCWKTLAGVPEQSVFTLARARDDKKFELFRSGIINIADVPLDGRTDHQQLQILGQEYIDKAAIRGFISSLESPITHLDFESFQQAVSEYVGVKPFSQIPFQYSIHIETKDGLEHKEFLGPVGEDPRRLLAEQLIQDIPSKGTILAFNMGFEKGVIKGLAKVYTDLSVSLLSIVERIDDLMIPFQKGWYYHPGLNGRYSIKKVLPALVPEMEKAYKELPVVHNGGEASSMWGALSLEEDEEKVLEVRNGLLEYCKLDTLAMVEILKVLRSV